MSKHILLSQLDDVISAVTTKADARFANKNEIPTAVNNFGNIKVGNVTVAADTVGDTVELKAGDNVTLTPDATNDEITISAKDTTYSNATTSAAGLMSADDKTKLNGIATGATANIGTITGITMNGSSKGTSGVVDLGTVITDVSGKVDKVTGKGLSTNDYTTDEKNKLAGIASGAEVNVQSDWNQTTNTADDFIKNKPNLGTAAAKNFTTSVTSGSADLVTSGAVYTAIDNLPEPMVFKGSVGTNGTITTLPTAAAANEGFTYKVISNLSTPVTAKIGDTVISNGTEWVVIPSGDEPSGTVTSVGITNGGGLTISGSPVTSSGSITVGHSNSVTAGTAKGDDSKTLTFGGTFTVPSVTYDSNGHITAKGTTTMTMPANPNTDTSVTSVGNHYAPTEDSSAKLSADASGGSAATWNSTQLVTGVDIKRDAKGHVVGVAVDSIKMPANPNTNTTYSLSAGSGDDANKIILTPSSGTADKVTVPYASNAGTVNGKTVATNVPSGAVFTDQSVSAVGNHYTPTGTTSKDASGGTLTDIANSSSGTQVVTGVNIDAAGHVTGVKSVALKATNSTYTVNNGTLTLQRNGSQVQTFSANQSGDKTANFNVAVNDLLTDQNLNNVVTPGFYNAGGSNSVTNKPSGVDAFGLEVIHTASGTYYTQILYANGTNTSYRRSNNNGTWSSWVEEKLTDSWNGNHKHSFTPAGSVSSSFTGSAVTSGAASGSASLPNANHTHSVTAAGSVSSSFTGSAVTSAASDTTNKTAVAASDHTHSVTATGSVSSTFTGSAATSAKPDSSITANKTSMAKADHTHSVTASGSVSSSFTGSAVSSAKPDSTITANKTSMAKSDHTHSVTAAGSVSSSFTGSAVTSGGNSGSNFNGVESPTYDSTNKRLKFVIKSAAPGSHTHSVTASGSVSSSFTGSAVTSGASSSNTDIPNMNHVHSVTAGGSVSSSFTGSAVTSGASSSNTDIPNMNHVHSVTATGSVSSSFSGTAATSGTPSKTTNMPNMDHTHSVTAAGSVSSSFSGSAVTSAKPDTTNVTSVATGSHTHSVTAAGSVSSSFSGSAGTTGTPS